MCWCLSIINYCSFVHFVSFLVGYGHKVLARYLLLIIWILNTIELQK